MDQQTIDQTVARYANRFPVPVGKIAEDLNIDMIETDELPAELSGSITKEGGRYYIYLNGSHSQLRKRFTVAHEIAHFVKHRSYLDTNEEIKNPSKRLNRPNGGPTSAGTTQEQTYELEADQYAAELLMPEDEFRAKWAEAERIEELISHFGVSSAAVNVRACKLGLGYFE